MIDLQPIKLNKALEIMRQKDSQGRPVPFQVGFHTMGTTLSKYKRVHLGEAIRCGLPRQHQASKELVGIAPLIKGKHVYSVNIRLITEFNNTPVVP
jgi:hypothetical protein